uniref:Uncharacterized protein n=1 Tax=Kalanchoe fedtschenkoi TaxID=63787 RepID=A0A7N0ZVK1_KALFE
MNPPPRRVATPPLSLKRKEREHFRPPAPVDTKSLKPPPPRRGSAHAAEPAFPTPLSNSAKQARVNNGSASTPQAAKPECNNMLLAGYLAHEFLTKGTIMGEKFDSARATATPPGPTKRSSRPTEPSRKADERYAEVASLLKTDGAHIPGIVNPTQLASYLNR